MNGAWVERYQLEITLLVASALRLCIALALHGGPGGAAAAACLVALTVLSLLGEPWRGPNCRAKTPYAVRHADSDGITQGTLAVPFVLASLAAVDPEGGWLPWLAASCAAASTTLWLIHRQSAAAAAAAAGGGGGDGGSGKAAAGQWSLWHAWLREPTGCLVGKHAMGGPAAAPAFSDTPAGAAAAWQSCWAWLACGAALGCAAWVPACHLSLRNGISGRSRSYGSSDGLSGGLVGLVMMMGVAAPVTFQALMAVLPNTMSLGECGLLTQGVLLAVFSGACSLPQLPGLLGAVVGAVVGPSFALQPSAPPDAMLVPFIQLLVACTVCGTAAVWAWSNPGPAAPRACTARRVGAVLGGSAAALVAAVLAVWTLVVFVPAAPHRVWVLAYWLAVLAAALPAMGLAAACKAAPQIILRKGYHLIAAALFLPPFFYDFPLLAASLAIALAALVAAEVARCTRAPILGRAIQEFMQDFVDDRDAGPVYITHFTLLLGLALPMWLAATLPCGNGLEGAAGGALVSTRITVCPGQLRAVLAGLSGVMVIGFGDTAASMVGRTLGRVPIHAGSHKTVEGTVAGAAATLAGWAVVLFTAGVVVPPGAHLRLAAATAGACLLEACTSQLDNILIPLWYLPHAMLAST